MSQDFVRTETFLYHDVEFITNYDGDTFDFIVHRAGYDFGFGIKVGAPAEFRIRIRLYRIDTFEMYRGSEEDKALALKARDLTREWISEAEKEQRLSLQTFPDTRKDDKKGKYGRYIGRVWFRKTVDHTLDNALCLSMLLAKEGLTTGKVYKI